MDNLYRSVLPGFQSPETVVSLLILNIFNEKDAGDGWVAKDYVFIYRNGIPVLKTRYSLGLVLTVAPFILQEDRVRWGVGTESRIKKLGVDLPKNWWKGVEYKKTVDLLVYCRSYGK